MKKKVRLRKYRESDLEDLHATLSDEATKKYFRWLYTSYKEQSDLRLKMRLMHQEFGNTRTCAVEDFWTRKYVGEVSGHFSEDEPTTFEVLVIIHPAFRGQGYAKAATMEYMKKALREDGNIEKFRLEIAESNCASKSVAKKLEFDFIKYKKSKSESSEKMEYWEKDVDLIK